MQQPDTIDKHHPLRLTLVIASLGSGGSERVLSTLANAWAAKGWHITILTFDDGSEPPFYDLDTRIRHHALGVARVSPNLIVGIVTNLKRMRTLRRAICDSVPDMVISFVDTTNVLTLLATRGLPLPIIVSERSVPGIHMPGKLWEGMRWWLYPSAKRVVFQSEQARRFFAPSIQEIGRVIPNPITVPIQEPPAHTTPQPAVDQVDQHVVLAMGRLGYEKGFDQLIHAFATIAPHFPDWSLVIWGEGSERPRLETLRYTLGLDAQVHFPGRTRQPFAHMRQADLFVLSSRFEGFPNVLCEAMSCGLPVISFDCPFGPREIIQDGIDGMLVPAGNVDALAQALARLMGDAAERQCLASRAPDILERFGLESVMQQWETLIHEVVS